MVYTIYMMKKEIVMKVEDWVEQISKYGDHYALGVLSGCLGDMLKAKEEKCEWLEENINKTTKDILEAYNRIYKRKEAV